MEKNGIKIAESTLRKYIIIISNRQHVIKSSGSQVAEVRSHCFEGREHQPLELNTVLGRPGLSFKESPSSHPSDLLPGSPVTRPRAAQETGRRSGHKPALVSPGLFC